MSFQAMAESIKIKTGDPAANHLLLLIANYANDEWRAWPTQERLASDAQMSRRTVITKIQFLIDGGFLKVETFRQGESTRNAYIIQRENSAQSDVPRCKSRSSTVQNLHFQRAEFAHKPIIEPIKEPITDFFDRFWKTYPNRTGRNPRETAEQEFSAQVESGVDPETIINGAVDYAAEVKNSKMDRKFVLQTVRWLNERGWEDYGNGDSVVETVDIFEGDEKWLALVESGKKESFLRSQLRPAETGKGYVLIWPKSLLPELSQAAKDRVQVS